MVPGNAGACCWRPTLSTSWTAFSNRFPTRFGTFTRSTRPPALGCADGTFCATEGDELVLCEGSEDPHPTARAAMTARSSHRPVRIEWLTRLRLPRSAPIISHLLELDSAGDLNHSVLQWARLDARSAALADIERATESRGEGDRGRPGRLVLRDPESLREHTLSQHAGLLVDPRPHPDLRVLPRRSVERLDLSRRAELHELELRCPLGPSGGVGHFGLRANRHLTRRRPKHGHTAALAREQPRRPDHGVPRERNLDGRGEDPDLATFGVVHEHRLAESEIRRNGLPVGLGHGSSLEEDYQRIATAPVVSAKHPQHVQLRHCRSLS